MRIAVNTRLLLPGKLEGIGWFAQETLSRITAAHPEHQFIYCFDRPYHARFVHAALYLGLVAVPMTGWTVVSVSPFKIPTSIFGLGTWPTLPVLPDLDPEWRGRIEPVLVQVHAMLAYALIGLVLLHATAAVWHGRTVLTRMVPGWRSRPTP